MKPLVVPDDVTELIEKAHDADRAYREGRGSLHASSTAVVEARNALMGWAMTVMYDFGEQEPLPGTAA